MDDSDKKAFALAMGELSQVCQGELAGEQMKAYFGRLSKYPLSRIQAACLSLGNQPGRVFFPSVGEFIQVLEGSSKTNANLVWQDLLAAASSRGYNNPPEFGSVTKRAVAAIGGWGAICHTPNSEQQWLQKRFQEAFEAVTEAAESGRLQIEGSDHGGESTQTRLESPLTNVLPNLRPDYGKAN